MEKNNKDKNGMFEGCHDKCLCNRYGPDYLNKVLPRLRNLIAVTDGSYKRRMPAWGVVFLADNLSGTLHSQGISRGMSEAKKNNFAEEQAITFAMRFSGKADLTVLNDQMEIVAKVRKACTGEGELPQGLRQEEWQTISDGRAVNIEWLNRKDPDLPERIKRAYTQAHNLAGKALAAVKKGENAVYMSVMKPNGDVERGWVKLGINLPVKGGTVRLVIENPQVLS